MVSSSKRLELMFWASLPSVITIILLLVSLVPKHISGLGNFMPVLFMIPIFYWGIYGARDMPYWFVFVLGLVIDSINGQPLGLSSLLNVFFLATIHAQKKYIHKEGFIVKWVYFTILLAAVSALHWLLIGLFYSTPQGVWFALIQWFLTLCCYPLFHQLFDMLHYYISHQRWQLLHGR